MISKKHAARGVAGVIVIISICVVNEGVSTIAMGATGEFVNPVATLTMQRSTMTPAWAPKPASVAPYIAPNKLLWRLSNVLADHAGQQDWTQTVVKDRDYIAEYISMAPGKKTKTVFYADDRVFWVVEAGQIRFSIEGQAPFVASKGFLVQVPYRIPFSMETVGSVPSLRFEVRPAGEAPIYPISETPTPMQGIEYVKAVYSGQGSYDAENKPFLNLKEEIAKGGTIAKGFVKDDHTWANIIRSPAVKTPPPTDYGHFHENFDEFWIILEGKMDFLIEGESLVTADVGDVVFAPEERWHRATPAGTGMATRLAITPRPPSLHFYQPDAKGGE